MRKLARGYLYVNIPLFLLIGVVSMFAPQISAEKLHLIPNDIAGTSELRGLYGGGFLGFAAILFAGLRIRSLASGMLGAMGLLMSGIVIGRVVSLAIDHEWLLTIVGGTAEALLALSCWHEYRQATDEPL